MTYLHSIGPNWPIILVVWFVCGLVIWAIVHGGKKLP